MEMEFPDLDELQWLESNSHLHDHDLEELEEEDYAVEFRAEIEQIQKSDEHRVQPDSPPRSPLLGEDSERNRKKRPRSASPELEIDVESSDRIARVRGERNNVRDNYEDWAENEQQNDVIEVEETCLSRFASEIDGDCMPVTAPSGSGGERVYAKLEKEVLKDNDKSVNQLKSSTRSSGGLISEPVSLLLQKAEQDALLKTDEEVLKIRSALFEFICLNNAVDCATVLLETGLGDNLNAPLKDGLTPLQIASQKLSLPLIKLLLLHGADPNYLPHHRVDVEKLPLYLALETLRKQFLSDWSPEKSVFKLICILCLKELKEPLAAVKLLATKTKEIEMISKRCLEKGEIHQLGALMLVQISGDFPLEDNLDQNALEEACRLSQYISNELKSVSLLSSDSLRKTELESAQKMLDLLRKACRKIQWFRDCESHWVEAHDVPFKLAYALFEYTWMGPEDVFSDDVKCLMPRISATRKAWLDKQIQKQMKSDEEHEPRSKIYSRAFPPACACGCQSDEFETYNGYGPMDFESTMMRVLKHDKKDEFVDLIKSWPCDDDAVETIIDNIFELDAVKCVGAILNREISDPDWKLHLESYFSRIGSTTPLHLSTRFSALRITALLLDQGDDANARKFHTIGYSLPLDFALRKISIQDYRCTWWRHTKSVFGLFVICLSSRGCLLEHVRLLAEYTRDIQLKVDKFVKERNLIELGALMLLGYKPSPTLLSGLELDEKEPMDKALAELLKVFKSIGNELQAYAKIKRWKSQDVVAEVYSLFEDAGLVVTSKDIPVGNIRHLQVPWD